jgi:predicted phage-related endonuclease
VIDRLISAEMDFQEKIARMIPPEISGAESDSNYLAATFFQDNGEEVYLSPELEEKTLRFLSLQEEIWCLEAEASALKNQLKLKAGEAKFLKSNKVKISMPTIKKTLFDSKRFAEDYPELYEKYRTKESFYRGFTAKLLF